MNIDTMHHVMMQYAFDNNSEELSNHLVEFDVVPKKHLEVVNTSNRTPPSEHQVPVL